MIPRAGNLIRFGALCRRWRVAKLTVRAPIARFPRGRRSERAFCAQRRRNGACLTLQTKGRRSRLRKVQRRWLAGRRLRKRKCRSATTPINTMNFRLEKQSATRALVKYHIKNSAGELCGSVSVPPSQEKDLLASWHGPQAPTAKPAAKVEASRKTIVDSLLKGPRLKGKTALLRS